MKRSCLSAVFAVLLIPVYTSVSIAEITPNQTDTNLFSITFDNVSLVDVVRAFTRISGVNIVAKPDDLQGNVTVNLTDVEWFTALSSILDMHGLMLGERYPGSGVYSICRKMDLSRMVHLLYQPPGTGRPTNHISLKLAGASLPAVLDEIARQAKINIAYEPDLAHIGNITVGFDNVDYDLVLRQIAQLHELNVSLSFRPDCYVIARQSNPVVPAGTGKEEPFDLSNSVSLGFLAILISFILIAHRFRKLVRHDLGCLAAEDSTGRTKLRVFWSVILCLCIIYGYTVGAHMVWENRSPMMIEGAGIGMALAAGAVTAFLLFLLSSLAVRSCRRLNWIPRGRWRKAAWILSFVPLVIIVTDAPPAWKDYTWSDLPAPAKDAGQSFRCYQQLAGTNAIKIQIKAAHIGTEDVVTNALLYSVEIEKAWQDIKEGRQIIEDLNRFDAIAELTGSRNMDFDSPLPVYSGIRNVAQTYQAWALLGTAKGNPEEGVKQLCELHSVVRKALPYSRTFIRKMVLIVLAGGNIEAAHQIASSPNCSPELLKVLCDAFPPLTHDEVSLKWPLMFEYLVKKEYCKNKITNAGFIDSFDWYREVVGGSNGPSTTRKPKSSGFWMRNVSRVTAVLFFKRNRTVRDLRKYYDLMMAGTGKQPPDFIASGEFLDLYVKRPRFSNLGGWLHVCASTPSFSRAQESVSETKVRSDLLAMELNGRLGQGFALKDYFTGGEYIADQGTGYYASRGRDGNAGTDDDVILGKRRY